MVTRRNRAAWCAPRRPGPDWCSGRGSCCWPPRVWGTGFRWAPVAFWSMSERGHMWTVDESTYKPVSQHHSETIFTIGNGYLASRGTFEEGHPEERRTTFLHGVFDSVAGAIAEIANVPD